MKKQFAILIILLQIMATLCRAQLSRFYQPREFHLQDVVSIGPSMGDVIRLQELKKIDYENGKEYLNKLIDWIFELKNKTNDKMFLYSMEYYYQKLIEMYSQDLSKGEIKYKLDIIRLNIIEEIDNCNSRAKDAPNKLWESGTENMKNQNYTQAIQDFTDLIQISPDFSEVYLCRGLAYFYLLKYVYALPDLNKYIEIKMDNPIAYNARGWVNFFLQDLMGALMDFNKNIELEPGYGPAYFGRGSAKSELNDHKGAINDYTKAIELEPDYSMSFRNRGFSKYKLKMYSEALKDFNKSIGLDSTNCYAYHSRLMTKFALNDFKGCIEDCNAIISLIPKNPDSYFYRGRAYYRSGNRVKACEDWSKAGELGVSEAYDYITKYCNK